MKPLVDGFTTKITRADQRLHVLVYPSGLDLSSSHLRFLTARIRDRRRAIGSRWRRLSADRQALLTLAHLRNGTLMPSSRVGTTAAYRYITEARRPPCCPGTHARTSRPGSVGESVRSARRHTCVHRPDRRDRPFYSGKHKKYGMNIQVLADPAGRLLWASPALPGAVHDIRAAREHGILDVLTQADINCWADKGYQGAGSAARVPYRGRFENLSGGQQAVNRSQAKIRALVEPAIATLKTALRS